MKTILPVLAVALLAGVIVPSVARPASKRKDTPDTLIQMEGEFMKAAAYVVLDMGNASSQPK